MDDSMDDLGTRWSGFGDELWRPKDDGSERLSPFLGLVGDSRRYCGGCRSNVEDETDELIDGWKAQSSMDELPLKRQGSTAR
jgi:hypothetical protein